MALLFLWRRRAKTSCLLENFILVTLSIFITLMALEFYFKVFFAETDNFDTLARRNWREQYYRDTFNSFGYRDKEWTDEMVAGKIKVMVVGDSFVEGVGIENPGDRFSDQLAQMLGPGYVVFNLGRRGANTSQEIETIIEYPYSPDVLILSYVINDVEGVARGRRFDEPDKPQVSPILSPLVQNSYAFNFLYWRIFRLFQSKQPDLKWQWLLSSYDDPEIWWLHQQELLSIYEGTQAEQIPLLVVVFPSMVYVEDSQIITERILDLYEKQGVPTVDVSDLIQDVPPDDRLASSVDAHPSELVHRLVAETLYDMFVEMGLVK